MSAVELLLGLQYISMMEGSRKAFIYFEYNAKIDPMEVPNIYLCYFPTKYDVIWQKGYRLPH